MVSLMCATQTKATLNIVSICENKSNNWTKVKRNLIKYLKELKKLMDLNNMAWTKYVEKSVRASFPHLSAGVDEQDI